MQTECNSKADSLNHPEVGQLSVDTFFELQLEEDRFSDEEIWRRQCLDEARAMAAQGGPRRGMIDELFRIFINEEGRTPEEWHLRGYAVASDAVTRALREVDQALGAAPVIDGPTRIAMDEFRAARASPECFVEELIYADLRSFIGAGGYGKTTLLLFELACLAGGADSLWGRKILRHGPCVLFTAEDPREFLIARLRRIVEDNGMIGRLPAILKNLLICDVSGSGLRLTTIENEMVAVSDNIDQFMEWLSDISPIVTVFDPLVSFGVGESRVNDAEQGLINAARRIRNSVGGCVTFVHHTGKQNARDGAADQYAGRGGSALSDGCRMVNVLNTVASEDWRRLTGYALDDGEVGLRMTIAKASYAQPRQKDILILRRGFHLKSVEPLTGLHPETFNALADEKVLAFLRALVAEGQRPTRNALERDCGAKTLGLSRDKLRASLDRLIAAGRIERVSVLKQGRGGAREYLRPVDAAPPSEKPEAEPAGVAAAPEPGGGLGSPTYASPLGNGVAARQSPPPHRHANGAPRTNGEASASPRTMEGGRA
jgi:RecA-family ATPase